MTFNEATKELCLECKKPLNWSGCGYQYTLQPKSVEYELVISKVKPEPPLFWHPV